MRVLRYNAEEALQEHLAAIEPAEIAPPIDWEAEGTSADEARTIELKVKSQLEEQTVDAKDLDQWIKDHGGNTLPLRIRTADGRILMDPSRFKALKEQIATSMKVKK